VIEEPDHTFRTATAKSTCMLQYTGEHRERNTHSHCAAKVRIQLFLISLQEKDNYVEDLPFTQIDSAS
jgi:hypothetical protein